MKVTSCRYLGAHALISGLESQITAVKKVLAKEIPQLYGLPHRTNREMLIRGLL